MTNKRLRSKVTLVALAFFASSHSKGPGEEWSQLRARQYLTLNLSNDQDTVMIFLQKLTLGV